MYCENCGTKLDSNSLFCSDCGTKVESQEINSKNKVENYSNPIHEKYKLEIEKLKGLGYKKFEVEPPLWHFLWSKGIDIKPPPLIPYKFILFFTGAAFSLTSFILDLLKYFIFNKNFDSLVIYFLHGLIFGILTSAYIWYRNRKISEEKFLPKSIEINKFTIAILLKKINSIFNYITECIANFYIGFLQIPLTNNRPYGNYIKNQDKYQGLVPCNACNTNIAWGTKICHNCGSKKPYLNFEEELESGRLAAKVILALALTSILILPFDYSSSPTLASCKKEHWRIVGICKSWSDGVINMKFHKCLNDQQYDNKKYDSCKAEGHIVMGPIGNWVPSDLYSR